MGLSTERCLTRHSGTFAIPHWALIQETGIVFLGAWASMGSHALLQSQHNRDLSVQSREGLSKGRGKGRGKGWESHLGNFPGGSIFMPEI